MAVAASRRASFARPGRACCSAAARPGTAIEVERTINATGLLALAGRQHPGGFHLAGQLLGPDRDVLRSLPNPLTTAEASRIRDARPGGPAPMAVTGPLRLDRRVSCRGSISIARQKIHVGVGHAGRTVTAEGADTTFRVYDADQLLTEVVRTTTKQIARFKTASPNRHAVAGSAVLTGELPDADVHDPRYVAGMSDFTIKALSPDTFDDFAALVERNKGMFASCWCTKFHPDCAEKGQTAEGNRALKQRLVADGIAHAALVYDGDWAVAWAQYGTPEELPDIQHRKEYLATAERLPDYRITCILVERRLRGQGLAAIALRGAVGLIARAGGGRVEGYPHDTGGVRKKNSSFLYNGTRTMYEREGFTYDRPKGLGNCVMVREVAPTSRD